jgi:alpha-L-fucosidase 2
MNGFLHRLCSACVALLSVTTLADDSFLRIVGQHKTVFTSPSRKIPSDCSVDAPLMGNGDTLVALGGGPGRLQFYINKNDLWIMNANGGSRPQPLARLDVELPGMLDATYLVEQDLAHAVTSGRFEKDGRTVTLETGVAATENLLWVKLTAAGGDVAGKACLFLPGRNDTPRASLTDDGQPANIGREQYGGSRWYFHGEIADVVVTNAVLSGKPAGEPRAPEPFDGKTTWHPLQVPRMGKTVSVAAWIKIAGVTPDANYIVSKGEWNQAYSLGLSNGRLRWAINGTFIQTEQPLETGKWLYVAGTYDNGTMRAFVNGKDAAAADLSGTQHVGDMQVAERRFESGMMVPAGAACAVRVVNGGEEFTLQPGKPVLIVAAVSSRFDAADFPAAAESRAKKFQPADLDILRAAHEAWWRAFWSKSFVEIPDKTLEQRYYLSHYVMACASRVYDFPPGLFGWVTTDNPAWNGDYHMNYNHVAPFYGLYAANHIEQADPCHGPILANADQARELCRKTLGIEGIFQYVGIGPKGSIAGASALMQKSNSSYSCVPLALRWYATCDLDYARQAYPFVRDTALFWENWLKFESFDSAQGKLGRYVIYKDAVHEGSGDNVNPIVSLAFVKMVMNLALDMSKELGVDAGRYEKWTHIRDHISAYPTCRLGDLKSWWPGHLPRTDENRSLPIFRYTEQGTEWWGDNTVGIQHIYPAGGIGLDSPPDLLERARNQIRVMNRWVDFNGMNSFYAAAARVGYDPSVILKEMRAMLEKIAGPNGMIPGNPHGMEHQSIVPNAIQEMLIQSHEGVIRLFPCWPKDQDARFGTLRARGAFLVSAEQKKGVVCGVSILSEKGRDCTVLNPWPGRKVLLAGRETLSGERFTFRTKHEELIELAPE